jgi:hypothetical protein
MKPNRAKALFLDIDGVLNSERTKNPRDFPYVVDDRNLQWLDRIVEETKATVVLISTWRYDPIGLFAAKHAGIRFSSVTPDLLHRPRREEIVKWLKAHRAVRRYAVLDDDDDELDTLPLFQPNPKHGLNAPVARRVIQYLNGQTDRDMRRSLVVRALENARAVVKEHIG